MKSIKQLLKRSFITGIAALTPLVVTIFIAVKVIEVMDDISEVFLGPLAAIPGLGFILFLVVVLLVGFITQNYFGKRLFEFLEKLVARIPFIKKIYTSIKQVSQSLYSRDRFLIKETVLVEYPKKGSHAMGFITSSVPTPEKLGLNNDQQYFSVFIPTTPNPTSGFLLILPDSEITRLPLTTEEGMKFIISLGAVNTEEELPEKDSSGS